MATPVYPSMVPGPQDTLQVLLVKAGYWLQTAAEALGGTLPMAIYPNMSPGAQDTIQVLTAKLAYWAEAVAAGGGSPGTGGILFTSASGSPPTDGSVTTQGYINTADGTKWLNTAWPTTSPPTWEPI